MNMKLNNAAISRKVIEKKIIFFSMIFFCFDIAIKLTTLLKKLLFNWHLRTILISTACSKK